MRPQNSLLATALALFFSISVSAQKDKDIPGWGKIDKADLELKECEFDKDAEAMILLDKGEVEYQRGTRDVFALKMNVRTRIKIFKEKGFRLADVRIPYYSDGSYEKIIDVDAVTYNLDASGKIIETKVDKKSFYRQKQDSRRSVMTFTFPDVREGTVLEYRYTLVRESLGYVDPWLFQSEIPTRVSVFNIVFPEYFRFVTNSRTGGQIITKKEELQQSLSIEGGVIKFRADDYTYKMKNVPALKWEPYMGSRGDYIQRIEFQLAQIDFPGQAPIDLRNTWPRLATSLMESSIFGDQIRRNLSISDELYDKIKSSKTNAQKLLTIFRYVQNTMEWNGVTDFYCENAKECWSKKSGSTGDINIILLNLLRDVRITCYPVLASTRDHGRVYTTYPMLSQFNTLLVYAEADDQVFILDASDKYNPPGLIPYNVLGTESFVVDPEKNGFITLWDGRGLHKNVVSMAGTIDNDGILIGEAFISSFDYARNPRVKSSKDGPDKYAGQWLIGETSNMKVQGLEIKNIEHDSLPLEQKFKFSVPAQGSGDYKYFTINLFTGLEKNPFIADKRESSIDFGYNQYYMMVGSVTIPDDHQFEELPKNIAMIMPDTSIVFRRIMEANGNRVSYRVSLEFRRPMYEASEYEEFKEFYKKLFANLNEQIVFRKKAGPRP